MGSGVPGSPGQGQPQERMGASMKARRRATADSTVKRRGCLLDPVTTLADELQRQFGGNGHRLPVDRDRPPRRFASSGHLSMAHSGQRPGPASC